MTKYCTNSEYGTVDNITTLETVDDAATQIMGDDWRMPTKDDFNELLNGTTNEWITNFNGTGVSGTKFTGSNGNSIFIPAAGNCYNGSVRDVGYDGHVWGSSLNTSSPYGARHLRFHSDSCYIYGGSYGYYRTNGQSVRGVRK